MSLIQHILTEGKKDILVNKIGLPEIMAEYCTRYYDKKFVLYWGSALADMINNHGYLVDNQSGVFNSDLSYETFVALSPVLAFRTLETFIKKPILPQLPKENLNKFKQPSDTMYDHLHRAENYTDIYVSIKDYAERTNQNFQNADFEDIFLESVQWHEQIKEKGTGKALQIKEGQTVIHEFNDGYYWVDLDTNKCGDEGDSMGHCGNTSADTLLSLRDQTGEPHVTIAYNYNGTVRQIKGKGNDKPVEKYHPYIVTLLTEDNLDKDDYIFRAYDYEYKAEDDFNPIDLNKDSLKEFAKQAKGLFEDFMMETNVTEILLKKDGIFYIDSIISGLDLSDVFNLEKYEDSRISYINELNKLSPSFVTKKILEHKELKSIVLNKIKDMTFGMATAPLVFGDERKELNLKLANIYATSKEMVLVGGHIPRTEITLVFYK